MQRPTFVYTIYIRTTPEQLWKALIDPAYTERWWRMTAQSEWQEGATMTWERDGITLADPAQVVLEAEPYRRLAFTEQRGIHPLVFSQGMNAPFPFPVVLACARILL